MQIEVNASSQAMCTVYSSALLDPTDYLDWDDEDDVVEEIRSLLMQKMYENYNVSIDEVYDDCFEFSDISIDDFLDEWRTLKNTQNDD